MDWESNMDSVIILTDVMFVKDKFSEGLISYQWKVVCIITCSKYWVDGYHVENLWLLRNCSVCLENKQKPIMCQLGN